MARSLATGAVAMYRAWEHAGIPAAPPDPVRYASLHGVLVAHILAASGCYEPALRDCAITCSSPTDCIDGQSCLEGYCAGPHVAHCNKGEPIIVDASAVTDDTPLPPPLIDARDICAEGCSNGTCIAGVCTIDCSATDSCQNDVVCPANLPCHVICGDASCDHKVNCTLASSCVVDCSGENSCNDDIQCPSDRDCDVTCSGSGSCSHRTKCSGSCACDVTCSGSSSCGDPAECPASSCRIGNGCSSQLAGCNTCP